MRCELDRLVSDGISDDELDVAVGYLTGAFELGLEDTAARMARNGAQLITTGTVRAIDEQVARWAAVDQDCDTTGDRAGAHGRTDRGHRRPHRLTVADATTVNAMSQIKVGVVGAGWTDGADRVRRSRRSIAISIWLPRSGAASAGESCHGVTIAAELRAISVLASSRGWRYFAHP